MLPIGSSLEGFILIIMIGETMKRFFVGTLALIGILATTQAQAMSVWNWSIQAAPDGPISGTLITNEVGYGDGIYTLSSFTVSNSGSLSDLYLGDYDRWDSGYFDWEESVVIFITLVVFGGASSGIDCKTGTNLCLFADEMGGRGQYAQTFKMSPQEETFEAAPVPIPAAAWLFMSGLIGLVWKGRKARQSIS
jgi:hypothetical protein